MPISRRTTYTANTIIDAAVHNLEHDDYVAGINANTAELANCVKLTGDQVVAGSKGFSNVPYTTGGDPTTPNSLTRKEYVDTGLKGFLGGAPPVYLSPSSFTVANIHAPSHFGNYLIAKSSSTTVEITLSGLNGSAQSSNLSGTVSVTSGSPTITGSGTKFLTDFVVGDVIAIPGIGYSFRITAIASDTSMTGHANASASYSGQAYKRGGETTSTWYNLYAVSDGSSTGLLLSTRNMAAGQTLVDLPYTPSAVLTGTVATTNGSPVITGTNTTFQSDYQVGDTILVNGGNQLTIASIASNTSMTATANATATISNASHTRIRAYFRQLPFAVRNDITGGFLSWNAIIGWPYKPLVLWPNDFLVVNNQASGSPANAWCGEYIPPISKMGLFMAYAGASSAVATAHYLKDPVTGGVHVVAIGNSSYTQYNNGIFCGVDSSQTVQFYSSNTSNGIYVWVLGYVVTEV